MRASDVLSRPALQCRSLCGSLFLLLIAAPVGAANPPTIQSYTFSFKTQLLAFSALDPKGNGFTYQVTSSSTQTTFTGSMTTGTIEGPGGGGKWLITPGGAAVGEVHTLEIQVTNANGTTRRRKELEVIGGGGEGGGALYRELLGFQPDVPTSSPLGLAALAVLVALSALAVLRAKRGA